MRVLDGHPLDQIFSHTHEGVTRHFNCGAIMRAIAAKKITPDFATVPIPEHVYKHVLEKHGVEEVHLARLTDEQLESPIMVAVFPDTTTLIIDGNHRIVKRYRKGKKFADALFLTEEQWTPYLVTDIDKVYTLAEAGAMLTGMDNALKG